MVSPTKLASAIPLDVDLSDAEHDAVLETALLAIASDGVVHPNEAEAFMEIAARIGADGAPLLERFKARSRPSDARLRELASALPSSTSRALAYRIAYVLSLADAEASDGEFEFDLQLIDALELTQAEADRIVAEVDKAVSA